MQNTIGHLELLLSQTALTISHTSYKIAQVWKSSKLFRKTAVKTQLLAVPDETNFEEERVNQRRIQHLSFLSWKTM